MAPEAAEGRTEEIGPRTAVYALGATLYQLLCERRPFAGQSAGDTLRNTVVKPTPRPPRRWFERPRQRHWAVWIRGGTGVIFGNQIDDLAGNTWGHLRSVEFSL